MANLSDFVTTKAYALLVPAMQSMYRAALRMMNPAYPADNPTDMPAGAIRWNASTKKWEIYSGSAWGDLTDKLAMSISGGADSANANSALETWLRNILNNSNVTTPYTTFAAIPARAGEYYVSLAAVESGLAIGDYYILRLGTGGVSAGASGFNAEIAILRNGKSWQYRFLENGVYGNWVLLANADGTGASGNWGITADKAKQPDTGSLLDREVQQIFPVAASVSANALTLTLNPTALEFRATAQNSGSVTRIDVPTALSLVVPNGATLGTPNGSQNTLLLLALLNGSTPELAVVNPSANVYDDTGVLTTVALDVNSDNADVAYSATARVGVPYRVLGIIRSTQATAGVWATSPSFVQGIGGAVPLPRIRANVVGDVTGNVTGIAATAAAALPGSTLANQTQKLDVNGDLGGNAATATAAQSGGALETSINNRLRLDANGGYNPTQRAQGQINLGLVLKNAVGDNTACGTDALKNNTGDSNCAFGQSALRDNTSGWGNVAFGYAAGLLGTTASGNTFCGTFAGRMTSRENNTFVGFNAGENNTIGSENTAVGAQTSLGTGNRWRCTLLGAYSAVTGNNQVQLGSSLETTYAYGAVQNRSDLRDKTDIADTNLGLNFILKLRPRDYRWDMREDYRPAPETAPRPPEPIGPAPTAPALFALTEPIAPAPSDDSEAAAQAQAQYETVHAQYKAALAAHDAAQTQYQADLAAHQVAQAAYEAASAQYETDRAAWLDANKLANITHDGTKKRNRLHHGLIAQEVKAVIDEMGVDFGGYQDHSVNGGDDVLSLGYEELIAPLIKAVQEQQAQIKALQQRVKALGA